MEGEPLAVDEEVAEEVDAAVLARAAWCRAARWCFSLSLLVHGRNPSGCEKAKKKWNFFTLYTLGFLYHLDCFALIKITMCVSF